MIEKRDYFEPAIRIYYYIAFETPFEIPVEVPVAAWTHNWRILGGRRGFPIIESRHPDSRVAI